MKENVLINRKYNLIDFLRIPLIICPGYTIAKILSVILNACLPSIQVLVTADFIDTASRIFLGDVEYSRIFMPLTLLMAIVVYRYLYGTIQDFVGMKIDMKLNESFRTAVIEKRSKLEYKHIENNDTWDLIKRTCSNPAASVTGGMNNILGALDIVIRVFSILSILFTQVWWAALVIIGITVPLFALAVKGGKASYQANVEAEKHTRRADYLHKVLSDRENIEERALFDYSSHINGKWYEKYEVARKINLKVDLIYFIKMKGSSLITVLISILIISVLLVPLSQGSITPGMFMGLVTAILGLIQMMSWQLAWITNQLAKNIEYLKDLNNFVSLSEQEGALDLPNRDGKIEFETIEFKNVSFQYPGTDRYILKNFNLKLKKNLHYAFVGVNGAGKTTITKLLTGMYDNYEGEILLNGKSLREYKLSDLKALFSVVYQDFARYSISMKDNIALGDAVSIQENRIDMDRIQEAVSVIGLQDTIGKLPNGMDTYLGKIKEGGVDLSGGEWQKAAIARTLYNKAQIRILDEPTAALDPVAESNIYEMFGKISKGKSTIFITHRLGAAKLADEIIVVNDGAVAEQGNHETLMRKGGIYAEMYESQRSWYQNE